jgi:tRNA pseudouridine55 synthase
MVPNYRWMRFANLFYLMDFISGETILVDKPYGWTSFDVVNKIRWNLKQKLKVKKIKVGHAGTLDPLATGLLVICTGKHTKNIEQLTGAPKSYTGTILLGKTTPSYDLETTFDATWETGHINESLLEAARQSFIGKQQQIPPIFSAKQIDGKRAYDYARSGKIIEMKSNEIELFRFDIQSTRFPEIDFYIECSKGTYIRSIAADFGRKLASGGTLISLRRTSSGDQKIENAQSVDEWLKFIQEM